MVCDMTDNTWKTSDAITRCAVCKIDLKGRFVYLDSVFERLIGQKRENLFGKSILNFLDLPSQDIIRELTAKRNHYESFFDAAKITLVSPSKRGIPVSAVISLNFIAGNPVNFIIIMTPDTPVETGSESAQHAIAFQAFLETVLEADGISDWREFTRYLRLFAGAQQAGVYIVRNQSLEPLSVDCEEAEAAFTFNALPELTELHRHIAVNGGVYDFTNQEHYAWAIEQFRVAPDEYIVCMQIGEEMLYLVRLIYDEKTDLDIVREYLKSVTLTLKLVGRLPGVQATTNDNAEVINVQFVIGLLDSLQCGAALTDCDGAVVGYNPTFMDMLQCEEIADNVYSLAEQIGKQQDESVKESFMRCFQESDISTDQCRFELSLPSGIKATLAIVRLADSPDDLTSCIVLLPQSAMEKKVEQAGYSFWSAAVQTALGEVEQAVLETKELEKSYEDKLGEIKKDSISKVTVSLEASREKLRGLQKIFTALSNDEVETITDLSVLVDKVFQRVRKLYPSKQVYLRYGPLPKIVTKQQWLDTVLEKIFSGCFGDVREHKTTINIQAQVTEGYCTINIVDNNVPTKKNEKSTKYSPNDELLVRENMLELHYLPEIQFLVESFDGELNIRTKQKEGTTITIAFPVLEERKEMLSIAENQGQNAVPIPKND